MTKYPKVVVFDLDYTLWPFWCDTHIFLPVKSISETEAIDRRGTEIQLFPDVESIILDLVANKVVLVAASRTATPDVAKQILSILHVGNKPLITYFLSLQWGQGSKTKHIQNAAKQLRMVNELHDGQFILFDDEYRNRDVEKINCKFAYLPDERLDRKEFDKGIKEWSIWHDKLYK